MCDRFNGDFIVVISDGDTFQIENFLKKQTIGLNALNRAAFVRCLPAAAAPTAVVWFWKFLF